MNHVNYSKFNNFKERTDTFCADFDPFLRRFFITFK